MCAIDRFRQALDCDGISTRQDGEVLICARVDGSPYLGYELIARHHMLARHVPAAFRRDLVLDHDRGRARLLELLHRTLDIGGISMTIVTVRKHRQIHRIGSPPHGVDHLGERQQFDVRRGDRAAELA